MEQEISVTSTDYDIYDLHEKRFHHHLGLDGFNSTNLTLDSDYSSLFNVAAQENPFSLASFICSVAMVVVAGAGTIANTVTAYVFSRPTMTSSISILLAGLAIVDACVLLTASPIFATNALLTYWQTFALMNFVSYSTVYLYPLASIFQTASVWILTLISSERFVAVFRPLVARTRCTRRRARIAVAAVLLSSLAYNVVRFWDYTVFKIVVAEADANATHENYSLAIAWPMLRDNKEYVRLYVHWLYFVFVFALPFSALLVFNGLVAYTIRQARKQRLLLSRRQSKEHATAVMMTIVVLVFLLCNSLAFVLNALEVFGVSGGNEEPSSSTLLPLPGGALKPRHSHLFYFLIDANNLLIMVHCSFNFFIYYHFNQRFRLFVAIRLRCVKRNFDGGWRGCFRKRTSYDDQKAENEEAAALDEIGLELLRLKRGSSSKTMVSYLTRVSTREEHRGAGRNAPVHRLPSICFADDAGRRYGPSVAARTESNRRLSLRPPVFDREEYCSTFNMDDDSNRDNVSVEQTTRAETNSIFR